SSDNLCAKSMAVSKRRNDNRNIDENGKVWTPKPGDTGAIGPTLQYLEQIIALPLPVLYALVCLLEEPYVLEKTFMPSI
ncbi:hypothetical protein ACPCYY_19825, partial [Bacillus pumilus]|uniref:hypothetical protein n=1 Tax=Bacillus pumilus TaxID=1408 RepID=UPI003C232FE5